MTGLKLYPSSSVVVASETSSDEMESYRSKFSHRLLLLYSREYLI